MKATINNNLIPKLKPQTKHYDVWDDKLGGFHLRVNPNGKLVYRCAYVRGKVATIGKAEILTPAQARDRAKQILGDAAVGIYPNNLFSRRNVVGLTFKDFIEKDYAAWRISNRKDGKNDLRRLKVNFFSEFSNCLLIEITPVHLEKWRTKRINNGVKASTINRDIIILKSALTKAVEWELITEHPLKKLKPFKMDSVAKIRYLHKEEETRLKEALFTRDSEIKNSRARANEWRADRNRELLSDLSQYTYADHLTPMILVSLNTGLRRGELFSLLWEDTNFERNVLTIRGDTSKNGKTRHVPLNVVAVQALKNWREQQSQQSGLVFPSSRTGEKFDHVKTSWANILESAKINNFRWHDMRHHFASKLVMAGVDLNTVRELLGHADIKMTLRYAHLAPEHKAKAVEKLIEVV